MNEANRIDVSHALDNLREAQLCVYRPALVAHLIESAKGLLLRVEERLTDATSSLSHGSLCFCEQCIGSVHDLPPVPVDADMPALTAARCGGLVDGVTGEPV